MLLISGLKKSGLSKDMVTCLLNTLAQESHPIDINAGSSISNLATNQGQRSIIFTPSSINLLESLAQIFSENPQIYNDEKCAEAYVEFFRKLECSPEDLEALFNKIKSPYGYATDEQKVMIKKYFSESLFNATQENKHENKFC